MTTTWIDSDAPGLMDCVDECQARVELVTGTADASITALRALPSSTVFDGLIAEQQAKITTAEAKALRLLAVYIESMWQFRYALVEAVAHANASWKPWTKVLSDGTRFARVYFGPGRDDYIATINDPFRRPLSFDRHATRYAACKLAVETMAQQASKEIAGTLL